MNEFYKVEIAYYSGNVQTSKTKRYFQTMVKAMECLRNYESAIIKSGYDFSSVLQNGTEWLTKKIDNGVPVYVRLSVIPMMFED